MKARGRSAVLGALLGMATLAGPAQAAPGDLDPTFGVGGRVAGTVAAGAQAVALQPDGKIVAVGFDGDFVVARFNADGSLDGSFSEDGVESTDIAGGADRAEGVAIQPDGKIVVAGTAKIVNDDIAVVRYNPDGSLDNSFSADGKQTTNLNGDDRGRGVVVQPDGGIVVAVDNSPGWAAVRYAPDGTRDLSFGGGGLVSTTFPAEGQPSDIALAGAGSFVIAGRVYNADHDFGVARYHADGSPDTTFDGDGRQTTNITRHDDAFGVAVTSDGKTVVAGDTYDDTSKDVAVARYTATGSLDPSFGAGGVATTGTPDDRGANDVALQPDGKVIAAGWDGNEFGVLRLTAAGAPDAGFGGDGWLATGYGGDAVAEGVTVQADGKIVVAGSYSNSGGALALARYEGGDPVSHAGGGGGVGGTAVDATPPVLTAALTPATFRVDRRGAAEVSAAKRAKRGTTFHYRLSEAARITFTIERGTAGRRVGTRCAKPTRSSRPKRRCTRFARAGRFATEAFAGAGSHRFSGRIGRRALTPGRYRAVLVATDAAGNRSKRKTLTFRVR